MSIAVTVTTGGIVGWRRWHQARALRETAWQLQTLLIDLRAQATWQNKNLTLWVIQSTPWCVGAGAQPVQGCSGHHRQQLIAPWPAIRIFELRGEPGFYGRRDVAKAGSILFGTAQKKLRLMISSRGRIRLCAEKESACE